MKTDKEKYYIVFVFLSTLGISASCDCGWTQYGDSCYLYSKHINDIGNHPVTTSYTGDYLTKFTKDEDEEGTKGDEKENAVNSHHNDGLVSYTTARTNCQLKGGDLVILDGTQNGDHLVTIIQDNDDVWVQTPPTNESGEAGLLKKIIQTRKDDEPYNSCTYWSPSQRTVVFTKSCKELRPYVCKRAKTDEECNLRLKRSPLNQLANNLNGRWLDHDVPKAPPFPTPQRWLDHDVPRAPFPPPHMIFRYHKPSDLQPPPPFSSDTRFPSRSFGRFSLKNNYDVVSDRMFHYTKRSSTRSPLFIAQQLKHRLDRIDSLQSRGYPGFLPFVKSTPKSPISRQKPSEGPQNTPEEYSGQEDLTTVITETTEIREASDGRTISMYNQGTTLPTMHASLKELRIDVDRLNFSYYMERNPDLNKKTYHEASRICSEIGASLPVLHSLEDMLDLKSIMRDTRGPEWIGLTKNDSGADDSAFKWIGGTINKTLGYYVAQDSSDGQCMSVTKNLTEPRSWHFRDCNEKLNFFCQRRVSVAKEGGAEGCLDGWEQVEDRCYKVFPKPASWNESEKYCTNFGAHLTSAGSEEEENVLRRLAQTASVSDFFSYFWVGLEIVTEGYRWTDGTPISYLNLGEAQPHFPYKKEQCGSAARTSFRLHDSPCDAFLPFICEAVAGSMIESDHRPQNKPSSMCEDDPSWLLYDDHCYKFFSSDDDEPRTWEESRRLCRDIGGELASIHSTEENYWLQSKVHSLKDNVLWLGGQSYMDSGYEWADSTPYDFTNWAKGEPNNNYDQEDCIAFYTHNFGYWNDQNCGHRQGRICKRPHGATHPPHTSTEVPEGNCPQGWMHTGTQCLKFITEQATFDDARKNCKSLQPSADLISISSAEEQAYVTAILGNLKSSLWIGLRYDNGFHWMDQSALTYTNWAQGEPSSGGWLGEEHNENCVNTHTYNQAGQWNNIHCEEQLGYICQTRPDPTISASDSLLPACDPPFQNYVNYSGMCYRPIAEVKTWKEAEMICSKEGGHLASAASRAESEWLWVLTLQFGLQTAWIGYSNLRDNATFEWSDSWPTLYTKWGQGEPNVSEVNHNCATVNSEDGLWYVEDCNEEQGFICKYVEEPFPTPDPPSGGHCPEQWLDLRGSFCYLLVTDASPWTDANKRCASEGSHLASIHTKEELELIVQAAHYIRDPMWIGLVQMKDGFGWSDGTGFDFINWKEGEPNSDGEECIEIYPGTGIWNDAFCSNVRPFVCKMSKIPSDNYTSIGVPAERTLPATGHNKSTGIVVGVVVPLLIVMVGGLLYALYHHKRGPRPLGSRGEFGFHNAIYSVDQNSSADDSSFQLEVNSISMDDGYNDDDEGVNGENEKSSTNDDSGNNV